MILDDLDFSVEKSAEYYSFSIVYLKCYDVLYNRTSEE